ncbi:MAG: NAD(P)H-dependent oxidoreductase subunit E [Bacillota bacterium]
MATCCCDTVRESDEKYTELKAVFEKYKDTKGSLIPVLHEAQEIFGYLPFEVQKTISEELKISLSEIYGVATFYSEFSLEPKGENVVSVCLGTACYVKGAGDILDKFKELLGIDVGECTADGKFSIAACRCIGACGLAPVLTINEDVHGRVVLEDVPKILKKYQ